jgi:chromosome partitioning protein
MTIIAFISQKGGVGKSTLARAVAVEASRHKFKTLLADCDPQQATSYHWSQLRSETTSTFSKGREATRTFNKVREAPNSLEKGKQKKSKFEVKIFPTIQKALRENSQYDLLIIDGPARTSQATLEIAKKADLIIQPTGASRDDLVPAVKEFNALVKAGIKKKKLLFALARLSTPAEVKAIKDYLADTGYKCSEAYLHEKASYKQVQNEGGSIGEVKYKKLAKQAKELVNEILNHL